MVRVEWVLVEQGTEWAEKGGTSREGQTEREQST